MIKNFFFDFEKVASNIRKECGRRTKNIITPKFYEKKKLRDPVPKKHKGLDKIKAKLVSRN